jgi:hypothetical protein
MTYKINALNRKGSDPSELILLDISFDTKELALQHIVNNLSLDELSYDRDVVVLENGGEKYHYFEIIEVDTIS